MKIVIIRHSVTPGNLLHHYDGRTDESLAPEGVEVAKRAHDAHIGAGDDLDAVDKVYVTSLKRTQETAAIMFPNAAQVAVPELREMDFGDFEGRSADEMVDDKDYRAWVDGMCVGRCPNGETFAELSERVGAGLQQVITELESEGADIGYMVVHGGTIMSIFSSFITMTNNPFEHLTKNCEGYSADVMPAGEGSALPFVLENAERWGA